MNAVTTTETQALRPTATGFDLSPQTFDQALQFADMLANSDFVPKDFKGKPGNCLIAMQWGSEIGLKPLQSIQNLAVINGRPALWGDSVIALVRSSPLCEYVIETDDGNTATCKVKRRGEPEQVREFSVNDAKAAGLHGKQGPWQQFPKRMRQMRARAFALRDVFPDVLRGMPIAEEIMDIPRDMGQAQVVTPTVTHETTTASPELVAAAEAAAAQGMAAYQAFWKQATVESRKLLADRHEHLKETAKQADSSRTVDAQPAQTGNPPIEPPTFAQLKQRIQQAASVDVLAVTGDWIGEVPDPEQREELTQLYMAKARELEGK